MTSDEKAKARAVARARRAKRLLRRKQLAGRMEKRNATATDATRPPRWFKRDLKMPDDL